jgi:hypothetical protein
LGKIIYINKALCLPKFYEGLPINYNLIENYVLEGKINNSKDIEILYKYVKEKLTAEITTKSNQMIIISSVEIM